MAAVARRSRPGRFGAGEADRDARLVRYREHLERAVDSREAGMYARALSDFTRAVELEPGEPEAFAGRGETYRLLERYDEALADFKRAVGLEPEYAWAFGSRAQTYRALERDSEALADLSRAIELDDSEDWLFVERGEVYQELERYDEALADFNRAVGLDPEDAAALAGHDAPRPAPVRSWARPTHRPPTPPGPTPAHQAMTPGPE
ncbi:tetratricopeptide repeat protein [Phytohabitans houttuyneae]|uniref:Uncharacterized protein n=1 Tax=Phytohabitans houttuyneae TaxID=1076126 RepID=A0A6V8KG82_9ACTN|nr:tetratricopeptide repeat protein [Phytohabitans houttuyneae]GFJ81491.1 hypothetical protein Phou_056710 [Phytohabitans houttuyneae]